MKRHAHLILLVAACGGGASLETSATSTATTTTATGESTGSTQGSASSGTSTAAQGTTDPTTGSPTTGEPSSGPGMASSTSVGTTDATTSAPCEGIECQIDPCGGDPKKTRLHGVVVAPEGTLPLYGVTVYVPGAPQGPPTDGVVCDACGQLEGDPIVATLTDVHGEFALEGVPAGVQVPLVVQTGKWRKTSTVPVTACVDNLAPAKTTRLPRDQDEGELPRIALTTGAADPLECLLRKIGVADEEFTPPAGSGRVHLYTGEGGADRYTAQLNGGALFPPAPELWDSLATMMQYDLVLMACEGAQHGDKKSPQARQNVVKYAGVGGRLFFTHFHNVWIEEGPAPWPSVVQFNFQPDLPDPSVAAIDASFPKGAALAEWMLHVGGSQVAGQVSIAAGQRTIAGLDPDRAQRWIYTEAPLPASIQHLTFNAPVGAPPAQQCGRVVDTDIHVSSSDLPATPFPAGCVSQGLSPQEKLLAFMIFELSSCLVPDDQEPTPG